MNVEKICGNIYIQNIKNLSMLPTSALILTKNSNGDGEYGASDIFPRTRRPEREYAGAFAQVCVADYNIRVKTLHGMLNIFYKSTERCCAF